MTKQLIATPHAEISVHEAIDEFIYANEITFAETELPIEYRNMIRDGALRSFSTTLSKVFNVERLDQIREVHVSTHYCLRHNYLTNAAEENQHLTSVPARDGVAVYLALQTELLHRFLSYCWAQGYLSNEYLRWSLRLDDLERNRIAGYSKKPE